MTATIITVGDELLLGQVVDSNASWLAHQLHLRGVGVRQIVTVGDKESDVHHALEKAWHKSGLIVLTGGLGPTDDDRTREALAGYFNVALREDTRQARRLHAYYRARGRAMPPICARMAMVPQRFVALPNPAGIAPGLLYQDGHRRMLVAMPGVPQEMRAIFVDSVGPRIDALDPSSSVLHRTLCTASEPEAAIAEKLADLAAEHRIAFLPRTGQVRIRLSAAGTDAPFVLERLEEEIRQRLGHAVYGTEYDTLEQAVGTALRAKGYTIAVAESCSGGTLLDMLTDVPGSSGYVKGGVVAYANEVKHTVLGVAPGVIERFGAVSKEVALQMASGVRAMLRTDVALETTGIAGPGGGTPQKPVGTVWIGYADHDCTVARLHRLDKLRKRNKRWSSILALDLARRQLTLR